MTNFIIITIITLPWIFYPLTNCVEQFRIPQACFLDLIFMGIIALGISGGIRNPYRNKYLGLFIGYLFLKLIVNFFLPTATFHPSPLYMLFPIFHITLGLFAAYILLMYLEKDDYIRIAKGLCLSSVLVSCFSLLQYFGFNPLSANFPGVWTQEVSYRCANHMSACLDNPGIVGCYLALVSPLFLYFNKPKYYAGYLLSFVTVILSNTHFSWVGFIFAGSVYLFLNIRNNKKLRLIFFGGCFVASVVALLTGVLKYLMKLNLFMDGRLTLWSQALEQLKQNPIFGLGLGYFKTLELKTYNGAHFSIWLEAHNDWLQYAIEIGLIGVVLFVLLIINTIRNYTYKERIGNCYFAMFITFLLFMCGYFVLEVPTIALLGLLSWVAVERL